MIIRKSIRDCLELKSRVFPKSRGDSGVLEEACVAEIGDHECDIEIMETEELGEAEHRVDMALNW